MVGYNEVARSLPRLLASDATGEWIGNTVRVETLPVQFYLLRSLVVMSTVGSTAVHVFRVASLSVRA